MALSSKGKLPRRVEVDGVGERQPRRRLDRSRIARPGHPRTLRRTRGPPAPRRRWRCSAGSRRPGPPPPLLGRRERGRGRLMRGVAALGEGRSGAFPPSASPSLPWPRRRSWRELARRCRVSRRGRRRRSGNCRGEVRRPDAGTGGESWGRSGPGCRRFCAVGRCCRRGRRSTCRLAKDSTAARSRKDNGLACKPRFLVPNTTITSEPLWRPRLTPRQSPRGVLFRNSDIKARSLFSGPADHAASPPSARPAMPTDAPLQVCARAGN